MRKQIPHGTKLPVRLRSAERDLVRDHTLYDPDFATLAVLDGKGIRVHLTLDDIEELQGAVAFEANHTDDLKLQRRLDRLCGKLQKYLDRYDDQE